MAAIFGHVTWIIYINFSPTFPKRLHIKFGSDFQAVTEEKMFEIVDGRRTYARAWVHYKLTYEHSAQVS